MYDFGTAHNFWIDIPVPQGDVFRQLSILNVQDSVLLTCIGALMNKSRNIFQQPNILYSFDMTGLTWLMTPCRNLPKEVLNIGTCARNGGEDLRNFWSWQSFFVMLFHNSSSLCFLIEKKSCARRGSLGWRHSGSVLVEKCSEWGLYPELGRNSRVWRPKCQQFGKLVGFALRSKPNRWRDSSAGNSLDPSCADQSYESCATTEVDECSFSSL